MSADTFNPHSSTDADHVLLVIGGSAPNPLVLRHVISFDRVVCADSGVDHARALGLIPNLVIGDMDSISDDARSWAAAEGASFAITDRDKDRTDTELALAAIASMHPRAVTVLWGGGNRIDHVLGVMAALAEPALSPIERLGLWVADDLVHFLHGPRAFDVGRAVGTTLSLVPITGPAHGVVTSGLRWDLRDETLLSQRARGVSNIVAGPTRISLRSGVLAVVIPGAVHLEPTLLTASPMEKRTS
ncbi:MAG: thiamine diphosphokinase [Actinobacteria bacterium]|nr:thiamine diphosphokinase [Actinomycetota bacterium]